MGRVLCSSLLPRKVAGRKPSCTASAPKGIARMGVSRKLAWSSTAPAISEEGPKPLLEPNSWIPAALGQECLWIGHLQNFAKGLAFIDGMLVIGFDDAISDPIPEVAWLFPRAVVKPFGNVGLVLVGDERRLDFFFAPLHRAYELVGRDLAGNQLGCEVSRSFDQGHLEHGGMLVIGESLRLLDMRIFVSDHIYKTVFDIGIHPVGRA